MLSCLKWLIVKDDVKSQCPLAVDVNLHVQGAAGVEVKSQCPLTVDVNSSVARGRWGEDVAVNHLIELGWRIVGRNLHPCGKDRRCELDIVAFAPDGRSVVFVEVKTHRRRSRWAGRLWSVDRRKKRNLLRASASWLMRKHWHGNFRFDVIEVYGDSDGTPPEIDHIENVRLFGDNWRWW